MEFPITLNLGDPNTRPVLKKAEDLVIFLDAQIQAWSWLTGAANAPPNINGVMNQLIDLSSRFSSTMFSVRSMIGQGQIEAALSQFQGYYTGVNPLPLAGSIRETLVQEARKELGDTGTLGILATFYGMYFYGNAPDQVRGVIIAHEHLTGVGKTSRKSIQDALAGLLTRISNQLLAAEQRADAFDARVDSIEARRRRQFANLLNAGDRARKKFGEDIDAKVLEIQGSSDSAIGSIRETEKTYSEYMGLKSPVTYWREKATEHRRNSRIAAALGTTFAAALTIYAFVDGATRVIELVTKTVNETHQWQVAYVVLTIVLFVLTLAFWIGRLISRTYVSQAHLALDADERATMVQTYLALTNENKISEAERILVLGALFRTSEDGLVKDDGPPDLGLAGMASRLGADSK